MAKKAKRELVLCALNKHGDLGYPLAVIRDWHKTGLTKDEIIVYYKSEHPYHDNICIQATEVDVITSAEILSRYIE